MLSNLAWLISTKQSSMWPNSFHNALMWQWFKSPWPHFQHGTTFGVLCPHGQDIQLSDYWLPGIWVLVQIDWGPTHAEFAWFHMTKWVASSLSGLCIVYSYYISWLREPFIKVSDGLSHALFPQKHRIKSTFYGYNFMHNCSRENDISIFAS